MRRILVLALLLAAAPAAADEGMWTYDVFPADRLAAAHGFRPDAAWLDEARLSSARLGGGCSASFVSPDGLVMTNHHCVHRCIEELSTAKRNLVADGFLARTRTEERRCPALEVNQLVEIRNVTDRLAAATAGLSGEAYLAAFQAERAKIEGECATGEDVRCDVITLHGGGRHDLYRYRRYQDVRLAFAPEFAAAFFGGDPDNFEFPRYDLDVAFLRIWEGGKPVSTPHHFRWSREGAAEGDLVFTSGHPGSTSREMTVAQLALERDVTLPRSLLYLSELRGYLLAYGERSPEARRTSNGMLFYVENGRKARRGMHEALLDGRILAQKAKEETALRAKVVADPALAATVGDAWEEIAAAQEELAAIFDRHVYLEGDRRSSWGFRSRLFGIARTLVRGAAELPKPSHERLAEFGAAKLPYLTGNLFSDAPVHADLEIATLAFSLGKLREELGSGDPLVRAVLGMESPREVATRVVRGSKLADPKVRRALWEGGAKAIAASKDPMIALAKLVDPEARAIRARMEERVEAPVLRAGERIAKARFAVHGTTLAPDATGTLRLSFGTVKGWEEGGQTIAPFTTLAGAFAQHTGRDPYALPKSWLARKDRLALETPYNLSTTNDIVGGNSGSPLFDRERRIVGLIFDGNIHSLGGDYGFDPATNRAVAVDARALVETLEKIYGARRLVDELLPPASGSATR